MSQPSRSSPNSCLECSKLCHSFIRTRCRKKNGPGTHTSTPLGMSGRSSWKTLTPGYALFTCLHVFSIRQITYNLMGSAAGSNVREQCCNSLFHRFCSQLVDEQNRFWRDSGIAMKSIFPPKVSALVNCRGLHWRRGVQKIRTNVFGGDADDDRCLEEYLWNGTDH